MPEYNVMGNPVNNNEDLKEAITTIAVITGTSESYVLGTVESLKAELKILEDEHKKLKELAESINSGCELKGETRDSKSGRQFRRITGMKVRENEEKLPKKLRNGW